MLLSFHLFFPRLCGLGTTAAGRRRAEAEAAAEAGGQAQQTKVTVQHFYRCRGIFISSWLPSLAYYEIKNSIDISIYHTKILPNESQEF